MNSVQSKIIIFYFFLLIWTNLISICSAQDKEGKERKFITPQDYQEYCRNFEVGDMKNNIFFSPLFPKEYPSNMSCSRVITAEFGYLVRIDFRDMFHLEPMSTSMKCEYDYLEIRDGPHGYSPLIDKFCGRNFPPMITSKGRSLWLRFRSDENIQYKGFKAVFSFIENPLDNMMDLGECNFEAHGHQSYIGSDNITMDRLEHSLTHDQPIDCVWTLQTDEHKRFYIKFPEYSLAHPNNCHLNYIQIYQGGKDQEHRTHTFCGKAAESIMTKNSLVYIRFYAEKQGIKNSKFTSIATEIRELSSKKGDVCESPFEYDCADATCIHTSLLCNKVTNCQFGWDEENCNQLESFLTTSFSSVHVIVICVVLMLIVIGMFAGMCWHLYRKLSQDRETIAASREKSLAASSLVLPDLPLLPPPSVGKYKGTSPTNEHSESNGGCYVPDAGYPIQQRV